MDTVIRNIIWLTAIGLGLILLQSVFINKIKRKRAYAIEPGGKPRIEIVSDLSWRKAKILFDGVLVKAISSKREFLTSQEIQLPDKSMLRIKLAKVMFSYYEVQLWRNGEPLHNFEHLSGPLFKVTKANSSVAVAGILPIIWVITLLILSLISSKLVSFRPSDIPYLLSIVLWGGLFLVLAFFGQRHSMIALFLATALYTLDGVVGTILYGSMGYALINSRGALELLTFLLYWPWAIGFLVMHIVLLVPMIQGCFALSALKKKEDSSVLTGSKTLISILVTFGLVAALYWAIITPQARSKISAFYSQIVSPLSRISPLPPAATPELPEQKNQMDGICWTYELKEFTGNRSQVWEEILDDKTRKLLPFNQFKIDVVVHNPQLSDDGYVFYNQKTYLLPEMCP